MLKSALFMIAGIIIGAPVAANAQVSDDIVRIGVLGDLSGIYADFGGPGNVVAARMAVEDFGGKVLGKPIDVIAADVVDHLTAFHALALLWAKLADMLALGCEWECAHGEPKITNTRTPIRVFCRTKQNPQLG